MGQPDVVLGNNMFLWWQQDVLLGKLKVLMRQTSGSVGGNKMFLFRETKQNVKLGQPDQG